MNREFSVSITGDASDLEKALLRAYQALGNFGTASTQVSRQFGSGFEQGSARSRNALGQFVSASNSSANHLSRHQSTINSSLGNTASIYKQLAGLAVKTFAVDKVLAFGNAIVTTSGQFERYQSVLTNALGSRSGAKANQALIADFAAATPNSVKEITEDFVKLVNRGITPTRSQLTNLGDLAASQGKGFDQLTEAVLDAGSGEFERLKEFGIRASKSGDQVTLSFKGVTQTVKATSGEITNAILKFGQMSGVAGSMSAVSLTLEGQISNLGDSFDRLLVALGEAGVASAFKAAVSAGQQFLTFVTDLISKSPADEYRKEQTEINGLVGAITLANDNEAVRLALIGQLNQQYPEFLGKLSAESVTTDLLKSRLTAVNEQYERKIRLAINQERLGKIEEQYTNNIKQQTEALKQLATESGKTQEQLKNLTPEQQVDLAKETARRKRASSVDVSYFGQRMSTSTDFVALVLEAAMRTQKKLEEERNQILGENAKQQADLNSTTIKGYQDQIALINQKIKLRQIDAAEGKAEVTRLNAEINKVKGIAPKLDTTPVGATPKARSSTPKALPIDNLAVYTRYAENLKKQIEAIGVIPIGGDSTELEKKQAQLEGIRKVIDGLEALTSRNQKVDIAGINELASPATKERTAAIVEKITELARTTPGLFAQTGINTFLMDFQRGKPTLEYYQAKIEEIKKSIAELSLQGAAPDSQVIKKLIAQLAELKKALADATGVASAADAATNSGAQGEDDAKWIDKANERIAQMKAQGKEVKQTAEEMGKDMKAAHDFLAGQAVNVLQAVGEGLTQGTNPLQAALQALLSFLGDYLIKIGSALLIGGAVLSAAEAALPFLAPLFNIKGPAALIAGGALVVGGGVVKGLSSQVKGYEKGGLFTGESLIRVGESGKALKGGGEWVSPIGEGARLMTDEMNRLGAFDRGMQPIGSNLTSTSSTMNIQLSGEVKQRGSDLIYAIGRAIKNEEVFRGSRPDWADRGEKYWERQGGR